MWYDIRLFLEARSHFCNKEKDLPHEIVSFRGVLVRLPSHLSWQPPMVEGGRELPWTPWQAGLDLEKKREFCGRSEDVREDGLKETKKTTEGTVVKNKLQNNTALTKLRTGSVAGAAGPASSPWHSNPNGAGEARHVALVRGSWDRDRRRWEDLNQGGQR